MNKIVLLSMILLLGLQFFTIQAFGLTIYAVNEPPSSYVNDKGEPAGFAIEVVKEIQHRLGNSDGIEIVPEVRALRMAETLPDMLLIGFSRTAERESRFHWIMLLMRKPWVLYAGNRSDLTLGTLEDAKKVKSIGVVRGDVRARYLLDLGFQNLEAVGSHEQNILKLLRNRLDLLYFDPQGMAFICHRLKIPVSDFKAVLRTRTSDVYLLMSKNGTPLKVVRKWKAAAEAIINDGTFKSIGEKWAHTIQRDLDIPCHFQNGALNF